MTSNSPGKSPTGSSPTGKSPAAKGPTGKSPATKGPAAKRPTGRTKASREAAARQAMAAQARIGPRRMLLSVFLPVIVVVLLVVVFVIVKGTSSKPAPVAAAPSGSAGTALEKSLASIPAATFDTVGAGSKVIAPKAITGAPLSADGKPRVLYVGAEYCPYCAGERWAVVAALSRFGTFSNLGTTSSSGADVFPNTATLSFHGASYTSSLLSFTGVELTTNIPNASNSGYTPLDTLTAADQQIMTTYNSEGSIPFVDFGNRYAVVGASYDVGLLQGLTQTQIAAQLADPSTATAKGVLGAANMITAALCKMTNGQPAPVCSSTAVTSATLP